MKHLFFYIKKGLKKHLFDYLVLISFGVIFLFFLKLFQGEKVFTFITTLVFVSFYIIWGVYHHASAETLHLKNLIEYIIIGFIIILLLTIVIKF